MGTPIIIARLQTDIIPDFPPLGTYRKLIHTRVQTFELIFYFYREMVYNMAHLPHAECISIAILKHLHV